ncbi:hypothetical protein ACFQ5Z_14210 [Bacillus safensis]
MQRCSAVYCHTRFKRRA